MIKGSSERGELENEKEEEEVKEIERKRGRRE